MRRYLQLGHWGQCALSMLESVGRLEATTLLLQDEIDYAYPQTSVHGWAYR